MTDSVDLGEVGISESKRKQIGTLTNEDIHARTKAYFCWNGPWRMCCESAVITTNAKMLHKCISTIKCSIAQTSQTVTDIPYTLLFLICYI
jgi:hypothetical protein